MIKIVIIYNNNNNINFICKFLNKVIQLQYNQKIAGNDIRNNNR